MRSETTPPEPESDTNSDAVPASEPRIGSSPAPLGDISWPTFLGMGIGAGTFFWLFWSVCMAVLMGWDLVSILVGPGAACGLFFGVFFGGYMSFLMRPAVVSFPIGERDAFLSRLDGEMAKLRYRSLDRADGLRTYGPRTLFRPHAFDIEVRVGDGEVTAIGPSANIKALKKRFEH